MIFNIFAMNVSVFLGAYYVYETDIQYTTGEIRMNSSATYSCRPHRMNKQKQDNQLELIYIYIYNSSVPIQDVVIFFLVIWIRPSGQCNFLIFREKISFFFIL